MNEIQTALKTLGLDESATASQIREAYRDLVKVWHPDRFQHDVKLQKKAEETLKSINRSYELLMKINYDNSSANHNGRNHHHEDGYYQNNRGKDNYENYDYNSSVNAENIKTQKTVRSNKFSFLLKGRYVAVIAILVAGISKCNRLSDNIVNSRASSNQANTTPVQIISEEELRNRLTKLNYIVKYVKVSSVNIRSKPELSSEVVGSLTYGERVFVISETQGWSRLVDKDHNKLGWVSSEHIKGN